MSRSSFEASKRRQKVSRLLAVMSELDELPTAADVAAWSSETWRALTDTANAVFGANMAPPSAASRALVVEELRRRELADATRRMAS